MPEKKSSSTSKKTTRTRKPRKSRKTKLSRGTGVGDKVEQVLESKPLKKVTEAAKKVFGLDGNDCGCDERRIKLNELFNGKKRKIRCLTESQYKVLDSILPHVKSSIEYDDLVKVKKVHASVFNYHYSAPCGKCGSTNRRIIDEAKSVYYEYKRELEKR